MINESDNQQFIELKSICMTNQVLTSSQSFLHLKVDAFVALPTAGPSSSLMDQRLNLTHVINSRMKELLFTLYNCPRCSNTTNRDFQRLCS